MVGGEIKFHVRQTFDNAVQMREIFREYAIQQGVVLHRVKNDNVRQTYKCLGEGCPWRAHGSRMIDKSTFMIKTLLDEHECHRVYHNKEAKVNWIASKFENLVKTNPSVSSNVIADLLRENYRVSVESQRLYNAKKKALAGLAKDHSKCFGLLRRYAYMLHQSNPRSAVHICTQDPQPTFERMFLCFEAQKIGFIEGCRPFIGVDGCHLKGPFGGVLLSVVALDANSIVRDTSLPISDLPARVSTFKKLFWRATRSSNVFDFNEAMNEIGAIDPAAKSWLQNIETQHWSRFDYDPIIRCYHVTNNMTEAFNNMLGSHRAKSYLEMLEFIRRMISGIPCGHAMAAISHYLGKSAVKDKISEFIHPSLSKSAYLQTYKGMIHPIPDQKRWPEVPACVMTEGITEHLLPPPRTVKPGRPKTQRKREPNEPPKGGRSGTIVCKICSEPGHNKRTCKKKKV
ncbi:hypothetical protein Q3G72_027217 [Acer saccharum]|nr:hypothetical protein Q3G72_027217 [Acer saccharum]